MNGNSKFKLSMVKREFRSCRCAKCGDALVQGYATGEEFWSHTDQHHAYYCRAATPVERAAHKAMRIRWGSWDYDGSAD